MYKKYFSILNKKINQKKLIYFDSACSYLKNNFTIKWINNYYKDYSCCSGDRWTSFLWTQLLEKINKCRKSVKKFINANIDDYIIFTSWTTDSINKLIFSINKKQIHTIITSDLEHNSNYLPQYEYSKQYNIDFKIYSYKDILDYEKLEKKIKKIKPWFLFCFTHSSNIIWYNFNIKDISNLVHKYWGYILVDDAQYIAYNKEDVEENNIDFLVFSAHKMWWPTWIWILYIKKWAEKILKNSNQVWWWTIKKIDSFVPIYKWFPYFFEWWVQNFAWILWLHESIKFYKNIWVDNINKYVTNLSEYFWKKFDKNDLNNEFKIISDKSSAIITLKPLNFNSIDFHLYCNYFLKNHIISFRTWTMCVDNYINTYLDKNINIFRLSFGIYNTKKEIDIFFDVLEEFLKK